jgi:hypothetical protein
VERWARTIIAAPEARNMALWRLKRSSLRDDPMSALGQKQTFALQKVMSALPESGKFAFGQKRTFGILS